MDILKGEGQKMTVLDAGCGDGVHCSHIRDCVSSSVSYTGVDISQACIEALRTQYEADENAEFHVADVCALPYADKSFDVVFSYGVIGYTRSPRIAFNELCRVLKDGGRLGIWVYPHKSGVGGLTFRMVRKLCIAGGPKVASGFSNLIVPLLWFLPTASKMHLGNSSWKQCKEVVLVNIAPQTLHFFRKEELQSWCGSAGISVDQREDKAPLTLWGTKVA